MTRALLDHAVAAVQNACIVCRHVQKRLDAMRHMTKDDASPVTIADYASQAIVCRHLNMSRAMRGGMVAEESADFLKQPEHAAHLSACVAALRESGAWPDATPEQVIAVIELGASEPGVLTSEEGGWTLDPIDGTKGFLRGEQYCVSLAMIRRGIVEMGVLGCPNLAFIGDLDRVSSTGSIYSAVRGQGTKTLIESDKATVESDVTRGFFGPDTPIRLAESVETSHTRSDLAARILELSGPVAPKILMDSQCKYALLARGDADVYLRLPSKRGYVERIWDHAAGSLIAQEGGCTVTDIRGRPLDFSRGRGLEGNEGIVGAPPELHTRLLRAIEDVLPTP